jgi:hypothetical protein
MINEMNNQENAVINTGNEEKISIEAPIEAPTETEETSLYKGMNAVFAQTRKIIDAMEHGGKMTVKDLSDRVQAEVSDMSIGNVANLVQMFLKKSKDVSVEIGRGGGVFKGGKPQRVDNRPRCATCHQVVRPDMHKKIVQAELGTNL